MSHVEAVTTQIRDILALQAAAAELGGELTKADTYTWYGRHVGDYPLPAGIAEKDLGKCDFKIHFPEINYEIGVKMLPAGHYTLLYDFYGSGTDGSWHDGRKLLQRCGQKLGKLTDLYEHHAIVRTLRPSQKHWRVDSIDSAKAVSRATGHSITYTGKLLTITTA